MKIIKINQFNINLLMQPEFQQVVSRLAECDLGSDEIESIIRHRSNNSVETLVAIHEEKIVGTVSYFIEQKFIHNGGKVGHLEDLVVSEHCSEKGIGKALVDLVVSECKKEGCYKVILDCNEYLETYYTRSGFYKKCICMRKDLQ